MPGPVGAKKPFVDIVPRLEQEPQAEKSSAPERTQSPASDAFEQMGPLGYKKPFADIVSRPEQKPQAEKRSAPERTQSPATDAFEPSKPKSRLDSALSSTGNEKSHPAQGGADGPAISASDIGLKKLLKKP